MTLVDVQAPFRIVERGRYGKYNRTRMLATYTLSAGPSGSTKVEYTFETEPAMLSDRLMETFGRGWTRRQAAKAMRRLRAILEENRDRGGRATIAAR